ncbi:MAG: hypothetical protein HYZ85_00670, partial [Candidatus Omnitrophica bacterium]|nr:hypothetical protein [Candidatus Omnitrophota bacterium]
NHDLNTADVETFRQILNRYLDGDVNRDGKLTAEDMASLEAEIRSVMPGVAENIKKAAPRFDLNQDGNVNAVDQELMSKLLGSMVDVDGDGEVTPQDLKRIEDIVRAKELNIASPLEANQLADVDKNGQVNFSDILKLQEALKNARDIDGSGKVDEKDVQSILDVMKLINRFSVSIQRKPVTSEKLYDRVLEIQGRILYVTVNEDNSITLTNLQGEKATTDASKELDLAGVRYKVNYNEETGAVTLSKISAVSVDVYNAVLSIAGMEYFVRADQNGTYTLESKDGKTYTSQAGLDVVLIEGKPFKIGHETVNGVDRIRIDRINLDSAAAYDGTTQFLVLNNTIYSVDRRILNYEAVENPEFTPVTPYFVFSDGANTYH